MLAVHTPAHLRKDVRAWPAHQREFFPRLSLDFFLNSTPSQSTKEKHGPPSQPARVHDSQKFYGI